METRMREELEMFIKYVVSSLSALHLLLFLYRNRSLLNTIEGITEKTGLEKEEAETTLEALLLSEIVSKHGGDEDTVWVYNPSRTKEGMVEEVAFMCESDQGSEIVLNTLVRCLISRR